MAIDLDFWLREISAARRRREQYESKWAQYTLLHAKDHVHIKQVNDDDMVVLPSGDQVRLGLIHSNVEQTMALLEVPELGVRVQCMDITRDMGYEDTHREAIVEQALADSSKRSGLVKGTEEVDPIKRDAVIIGHGICYTWYRIEEVEEVIDYQILMAQDETGNIAPILDEETGENAIEPITQKRRVWEAVQDEHVPVLEFLFDARAMRIERARWHGREQVIRLAELKQNPRYNIPGNLEPTSYRVKDLYGWEDSNIEFSTQNDAVKRIVIWDKQTKRLLSFIESPQFKDGQVPEKNLLLIADEPWPVMFSHPDASPFNAFVPIPANDHPFGVSQIEHIRNPAIEGDKIRTRQANLTRQLKIIDVVRRGVLNPDELRRAYESADRSVVEMDLPDDFNRDRDITQITMPGIPADLYKQEALAQETVRSTSGISEIPYGGASTATESENMMSVGGARVSRKRNRYLAFCSQVLARHKDFLARFGPEGQLVTVVGDDGLPVVLRFGREALAGEFDIAVIAGGMAAANAVEQKTFLEFLPQVLGRFGPTADRLLIREAAIKFGIRSIDKIIGAMQPFQGPGAGGVDGRLRQDRVNPNDYTQGQALRAAINSPNE